MATSIARSGRWVRSFLGKEDGSLAHPRNFKHHPARFREGVKAITPAEYVVKLDERSQTLTDFELTVFSREATVAG